MSGSPDNKCKMIMSQFLLSCKKYADMLNWFHIFDIVYLGTVTTFF
jgi:hypothetical protein